MSKRIRPEIGFILVKENAFIGKYHEITGCEHHVPTRNHRFAVPAGAVRATSIHQYHPIRAQTHLRMSTRHTWIDQDDVRLS
jgi:hypothetical protein